MLAYKKERLTKIKINEFRHKKIKLIKNKCNDLIINLTACKLILACRFSWSASYILTFKRDNSLLSKLKRGRKRRKRRFWSITYVMKRIHVEEEERDRAWDCTPTCRVMCGGESKPINAWWVVHSHFWTVHVVREWRLSWSLFDKRNWGWTKRVLPVSVSLSPARPCHVACPPGGGTAPLKTF